MAGPGPKLDAQTPAETLAQALYLHSQVNPAALQAAQAAAQGAPAPATPETPA